MLDIPWSDSQTYWLNVTNIALGIVTLVCVLVVAAGVVQELLLRLRKRSDLMSEIDRELPELLAGMEDGHVYGVSEPGASSAKEWGNPRKK